jgi:hypothetical protein
MAGSLSFSQSPLRRCALSFLLLIFSASTFFESKIAFGCYDECDGKESYDLSSTTSFKGLWNMLLSGLNHCESRDEFLFLYPFRLEKPEEIAPLWNMVYGGKEPSFPEPNADLLVSSCRNSDWNTARKEARIIVDQVLNMPGAIGAGHQPALIQAVEFLEIQPLFRKMDPERIKSALWSESPAAKSGDLPPEIRDVLEMRNLNRGKINDIIKANPHHPRIGTLRFVALRSEFAQKVPDGWLNDIQGKVSKKTWQDLEESADLWLKDYPEHPLADLVRLWKSRIYYFKGDIDGAWKQLLSVYPRRLPRVLYEMRYLLVYSDRQSECLRAIEDPLLFTALLPTAAIDSDQWEQLWKMSEKNRGRPWATNLQERLLAEVPRSGELPLSFPKEPRNPTQLWGKLRALALMNAEKWEDARKQLFSLAPDEEQALLAATFHLRRGQPLLAAQVINLPELIRLYLVRVLFDDEELSELQTKKNTILKKEILSEQGVRLTEKGKWADAARIIRTIDPGRSALWQNIARLKTDASPSARLKLARFLRENRGKLFYADHPLLKPTVWSRYAPDPGMVDNTSGLPWTRGREQEAIMRHILGTTELWLALQAYVDWLSTAKPSPQMSHVVREADYCYNRLIGQGYWSGFWYQYLPDHPVVKKLREEGIRAKGE